MAGAWREGQLWCLLREDQYPAYVWIRRHLHGGDSFAPFWRYILNWRRRKGKTYVYLVVVLEEIVRRSGIRCNFASGTKAALKQIVWPIVRELLATCPDEELRPVARESAGQIDFQRGGPETLSSVVLAGCDDSKDIERLRGTKSEVNVVSEAGVIDRLNYLLTGILNPQLYSTEGATLMEGTPAVSSGHEYNVAIQSAEALDARDGTPEARISRKGLAGEMRSDEEERLLEQYLKSDAEYLGLSVEAYKLTAGYLREWEVNVQTDPDWAILPEATEERMRLVVLPDSGMPSVPMFRDRYGSLDLGFADPCGYLMGYWDYPAQVLVIENELLMKRFSDTRLAEAIGGKWLKEGREGRAVSRVPFEGEEARLYGRFGIEYETWGEHPPSLRVADNNFPMTLAELAQHHGLLFVPTRKDELEAAIANVNRWLLQGKIRIHRRCVSLILQMKDGVWNKTRTEFAHTTTHGHFDLVAALIYLVRNAWDLQAKIPDGWGMTEESWRRGTRQPEVDSDTRALRRVFG